MLGALGRGTCPVLKTSCFNTWRVAFVGCSTSEEAESVHWFPQAWITLDIDFIYLDQYQYLFPYTFSLEIASRRWHYYCSGMHVDSSGTRSLYGVWHQRSQDALCRWLPQSLKQAGSHAPSTHFAVLSRFVPWEWFGLHDLSATTPCLIPPVQLRPIEWYVGMHLPILHSTQVRGDS